MAAGIGFAGGGTVAAEIAAALVIVLFSAALVDTRSFEHEPIPTGRNGSRLGQCSE